MVVDVGNPRRILALSLGGDARCLSRVITDFSGSAPLGAPSSSPPSSSPASTSLAGTTHHIALSTRYYRATVPAWLDLVADPAEWADSFLSDEAGEVLAALGAVVVVFALPPSPGADALLRHVGRVLAEGLGGWEWDGVRLAVGVGEGPEVDAEVLDEWDDLCTAAGLEFVHVTGEERQDEPNEFRERTGMARVREALEANDWAAAGPGSNEGSDFGFEEAPRKGKPAEGDGDDVEALDFGLEEADLETLREAMLSTENNDGGSHEDDDEKHDDDKNDKKKKKSSEDGTPEDVPKLEALMQRLQAVRDAGAGMHDAQRRQMAARAVAEAMKELHQEP